jgi:hypothetical protein
VRRAAGFQGDTEIPIAGDRQTRTLDTTGGAAGDSRLPLLLQTRSRRSNRAAQRGMSGTNMMWARAVPGNMSQGELRAGVGDRPVDSTVANGM